jgi:hypothetical protein
MLSSIMPAKPRWHAHLARIRTEVTALSSPLIDRPAIEKLFGLRRRQANYLMADLAGYRIGPSSVVAREGLLAKLDQLGAERATGGEQLRRARLVESLDQIRSRARPRPIEAPPARPAGAALPEGARISAPGQLTLAFSSPEQLLGLVLGLAQSAAGDFAAFAAGLGLESDADRHGRA